MIQVTLNVKDNRKFHFFLELVKNLDFVELHKSEVIDTTDETTEKKDRENIAKEEYAIPAFDEFVSDL